MEGTVANRRGHVHSQSMASNFFKYLVDKTKLIRERDLLHGLQVPNLRWNWQWLQGSLGNRQKSSGPMGCEALSRGTQTAGEMAFGAEAYLGAVVTDNVPHGFRRDEVVKAVVQGQWVALQHKKETLHHSSQGSYRQMASPIPELLFYSWRQRSIPDITGCLLNNMKLTAP